MPSVPAIGSGTRTMPSPGGDRGVDVRNDYRLGMVRARSPPCFFAIIIEVNAAIAKRRPAVATHGVPMTHGWSHSHYRFKVSRYMPASGSPTHPQPDR